MVFVSCFTLQWNVASYFVFFHEEAASWGGWYCSCGQCFSMFVRILYYRITPPRWWRRVAWEIVVLYVQIEDNSDYAVGPHLLLFIPSFVFVLIIFQASSDAAFCNHFKMLFSFLTNGSLSPLPVVAASLGYMTGSPVSCVSVLRLLRLLQWVHDGVLAWI